MNEELNREYEIQALKVFDSHLEFKYLNSDGLIGTLNVLRKDPGALITNNHREQVCILESMKFRCFPDEALEVSVHLPQEQKSISIHFLNFFYKDLPLHLGLEDD